MYNKVADSGEVVTQEQGFSIVGTHERAIATPLSPVCLNAIDSYPHRNQIFLVGRHQEIRQFVSSGLHQVKSVSSHCEMLHNGGHTSVWFGSVCFPGRLGNGGEAKVIVEYGGEIW